jgi:hypothetical protein
MILAYLLLLTGLTISAVAIYYSVVGLTAIFSAAVIPIIIMGSALEVGKLVCASWLKENWHKAPAYMKYYMVSAVAILMLITSMGIFGFLSKAHNDQNLVSGDVQSKIAVYDEKLKTEKENIDANRKVLKQLDEAVDQVMGRSTDEKGAEKAVAIRKAQQKDRGRITQEIAQSQKIIATLNSERAPIAAEVRKVEAEVGPIKYIAKFIYGDHGADENMLEKAVTWIIIMIVVVFDPLAVIMLLAAQMTFGWKKEEVEPAPVSINDFVPQPTEFIPKEESAEGNSLTTESKVNIVDEATVTEIESPSEPTQLYSDVVSVIDTPPPPAIEDSELDKWNKMVEEAEKHIAVESTVEERVAKGETYINTAGAEVPAVETPADQPKTILFSDIMGGEDESKKKTYMTKDETGQIQIKNRI